MSRPTHSRLVTNAFLADFCDRNDRVIALRLPEHVRPNVRREGFKWAGAGEIMARLFAYSMIGLLAMATGAAIVIVVMRVLA